MKVRYMTTRAPHRSDIQPPSARKTEPGIE